MLGTPLLQYPVHMMSLLSSMLTLLFSSWEKKITCPSSPMQMPTFLESVLGPLADGSPSSVLGSYALESHRQDGAHGVELCILLEPGHLWFIL